MTCICVEPEECSECSKDAEISMLRAEIDHLRKLRKMAEDELIESDNHGRAQAKRADALEAEVEMLRDALRDMVTLVEQVEAFPTIVAQHNGLTNEGLKQLDQARAILYEKDK